VIRSALVEAEAGARGNSGSTHRQPQMRPARRRKLPMAGTLFERRDQHLAERQQPEGEKQIIDVETSLRPVRTNLVGDQRVNGPAANMSLTHRSKKPEKLEMTKTFPMPSSPG